MTGDDTAKLIYLVALGAVIGGWLLMQNRRRMGHLAQLAALWGFIFVGAIIVAGLWSDLRRTVAPPLAQVAADGRLAIPRGPGGHYHVTAEVNGTPVEFIVDTGASGIVLSQADALRAGIDVAGLAYWGEAMTANGPVRTAPVQLESLALGPFEDRGLRAWVNEGTMEVSLLGMSYLQRFERIEIAEGRLWLSR